MEQGEQQQQQQQQEDEGDGGVREAGGLTRGGEAGVSRRSAEKRYGREVRGVNGGGPKGQKSNRKGIKIKEERRREDGSRDGTRGWGHDSK